MTLLEMFSYKHVINSEKNVTVSYMFITINYMFVTILLVMSFKKKSSNLLLVVYNSQNYTGLKFKQMLCIDVILCKNKNAWINS